MSSDLGLGKELVDLAFLTVCGDLVTTADDTLKFTDNIFATFDVVGPSVRFNEAVCK